MSVRENVGKGLGEKHKQEDAKKQTPPFGEKNVFHSDALFMGRTKRFIF